MSTNRSGGVVFIHLDRPSMGNALSQELVRALSAAFHEALSDTNVHTIAFVGEGRSFCTGFDLSDLETANDASLLQRFIEVEMLLDAVWRAPVRTAALAQGRAWGAGADLFAACDVRLAAPDADFRFPGAGFGLVLGTRRLAVRVGRDEARRFCCEGRSATASLAMACGLVGALVPDASSAHVLEHCRVSATDRLTIESLRSVTAMQDSDADLAALVRSASRPGLRQRIVDYRLHAAKRASHSEAP
jgi:enoyl-CoA hydratase/carnithine racemase